MAGKIGIYIEVERDIAQHLVEMAETGSRSVSSLCVEMVESWIKDALRKDLGDDILGDFWDEMGLVDEEATSPQDGTNSDKKIEV